MGLFERVWLKIVNGRNLSNFGVWTVWQQSYGLLKTHLENRKATRTPLEVTSPDLKSSVELMND